jgi:hypothetical protein
MDLKREYIVVMVEEDNTETYEYFTNKQKAIDYAESMLGEYKGVGVLLEDYENETREIIWESEE